MSATWRADDTGSLRGDMRKLIQSLARDYRTSLAEAADGVPVDAVSNHEALSLHGEAQSSQPSVAEADPRDAQAPSIDHSMRSASPPQSVMTPHLKHLDGIDHRNTRLPSADNHLHSNHTSPELARDLDASASPLSDRSGSMLNGAGRASIHENIDEPARNGPGDEETQGSQQSIDDTGDIVCAEFNKLSSQHLSPISPFATSSKETPAGHLRMDISFLNSPEPQSEKTMNEMLEDSQHLSPNTRSSNDVRDDSPRIKHPVKRRMFDATESDSEPHEEIEDPHGVGPSPSSKSPDLLRMKRKGSLAVLHGPLRSGQKRTVETPLTSPSRKSRRWEKRHSLKGPLDTRQGMSAETAIDLESDEDPEQNGHRKRKVSSEVED